MTKVQLPEIVVGDKEDRLYRNHIIMCICGENRLGDKLHNHCLEKVKERLPFDYVICDLPDTEEYLGLIDNKQIQLYKYYDAVSVLPEKYTHIIRVRNDLIWDDGLVGTRYVCDFAFREDYTIGMQTLAVPSTLLDQSKRTCLFLGDLIIFHRRDRLSNPRNIKYITSVNRVQRSSECHRWWQKMFRDPKRTMHLNAFIKVYKPPPEDEWPQFEKVPPDLR